MESHPIEAWHELVGRRDPTGLDSILADDVVFHSPIVHTPQRGRAVTAMYLTAAFEVFMNDSFRYVRDLRSDAEAVLEFNAEIDGVEVDGVDIVSFDADGRIVEFRVMVRPLKAIETVHRRMGELVQRMQS